MTEEIKGTTKRSPRLRVLGLMTSSLGGWGARVLGGLGTLREGALRGWGSRLRGFGLGGCFGMPLCRCLRDLPDDQLRRAACEEPAYGQ